VSRPGSVNQLVHGLRDLRFRVSLTAVAMPALYLVALAFAAVVPGVLTVIAFNHSTTDGLLFLILVAPLLFVVIAAGLRLSLEFLVAISGLAANMAHVVEVADRLDATLTELDEPISQLSTELRNVQFWRFARRRGEARGGPDEAPATLPA
jgi:predicted ABC-type sugar transport system permease subunit